MRYLIVFFLCFHLGENQDSQLQPDLGQRKKEEWNQLLEWFREAKTKEQLSKNEYFQRISDEYGSGALEDEAGGNGSPLIDPDMEWDRLVNGIDSNAEEEGEGEKTIRGASLAFVFDSTGSMRDELRQVKVGASKILAALRDHPDAPIYNYIWVPFNDPVIGPVTVTNDHKLFQERMQDVMVSGGGDCPEMSIGAIKKALEVSLPNSYIYVFTDASAKDHRLQNEVISMVQRKQAQVVFILTGDCQDLDEPNYRAYERIAETSSGQIYRLSRNEVNEVLKYVKVALQPHVVSLVSLNKPAPDKENPDKLEVVIDESLKQFTVSVSGANATINVTDPKGVNIDGPPKLENVLNLTNIKIVNVKEPDPGSWNVYINSDSNYTVRSTGLSKVNFNHGFSTVETINLKETNYRPLKGANSFLLIQTSDAEKVHNITSVDFVSLGGEVIQHLNLYPVPGKPGLYQAKNFVAPSEFFYLGVTGFNQDGLPIRRITSTAVSAQLPEKPIVSMKTKAVGHVNNSGSIKCYVESVVPFTVRWYKNGNFIGEEKNCSETCEVTLKIEKFSIQSEGIYSCSAKNVAGSDSKSLTLTVIENAPSVTVKSPVIATIGERVLLDCFVDSKTPVTVKWTQFTARNQHSGVLHPVSTGIKLQNNSLMIDSAKAEDEGWYVCNAGNKGGESKGRILLIVKEPLIVKVEPSVVNFVEGGSARFSCSASGKPQPRLEWIKDQEPIKDEDPSIFIEEINGKLNLIIDYLEKRNAGIYTCSATNQEESASATAELIYTEKPKVKAKENNVMVKAGFSVTLQCSAVGKPEPEITWFKRDSEITDDSKFEVEGGKLTLLSAESSDGGEYSCVANNSLGSDVDYIGLIVGSSPTFLQKPRDKKIQINHNGTIACSAIGIPPPEIKWKRTDGRELDSTRMFTLTSGALRITKTKLEDAGLYLCTAENIFGFIQNEVSIKVIGIEKPVPDKNIELRNVEALAGNELSIPCGIILGNPPAKVKWLKNGIEVQENELVSIEPAGNLLIRNATASDRGSYLCLAQNAAGNTSRPYEVVISESPKIKEGNRTELKAKVGGEIVIPCAVDGYPVPAITWTRNGHPLPMSSTIGFLTVSRFQNENGSLIIRNLTEDSTGVYVCTAINAVGSASKATSIHVQVPPVFPTDTQDSPIPIVEGHVVVLNCNVTAVPEPSIQWFKNGEPLLQDGDQPKILRFVANVDDTGVFRCLVENEAGSSIKEFNVTVLVPPKILGRNSEESIKAKAGTPITLVCNVFGVPPPTILWQRNGMYLTQNTTEVTITESGTLIIQKVTGESAGAYTCDAENLGGITQRTYYLQVNYPPKILQDVNISREITLKEGEEYSLSCLVEGNPKPQILWRKNGIPIHGQHHDLILLEDNTLVFLQVTKETSGIYKCEALNSEGSSYREHEIKVLVPPSLSEDFYPTKLEVNEGDSIILTCPTEYSDPPPHIQWIKNGEPLNLFLQERSDEAQMKLSLDQRTLTIIEAHPSDRGNYSCVATNPAGRTDAKFLVDVLMTPHFEEFNHIAHRTILTGGEVILNCSVSGNPQPKVTWRKENTPVTPHNTPGVHVSLDKQHLIITNGRIHHTGTYVCSATNKVNAKEREFYVTVLEPPQISGPLQVTIDIMKGDNITLECEGGGVPPPTYSWTKEENTKKLLNNTQNHLHIINATCEDSGIYTCDITNTAGTRTKHYELTVLEAPEMENSDKVEEVAGVVGGNITMRCKARGHPKPDITWVHNGHNVRKRSVESYSNEDGYATLTLTNVQERNGGRYTAFASNKAGVVHKDFLVHILVPPKLNDGLPDITFLKVVHPFPIVLKCPVYGDPKPQTLWFYPHEERLSENEFVSMTGNELRIKNSRAYNSGVYKCLAENPAGNVSYYFNVTVIEPPTVDGQPTHIQTLLVNETLTLHCNTTGNGDLSRVWFHASTPLANSSDVFIQGKTLTISNVQAEHSGVYSCLTTNAAGSVEVTYTVDVQEPPSVSPESSNENHKKVQLHRPFSLSCVLTGNPPPEITWFKDGKPFEGHSLFPDNSYLKFPSSIPEDGGEYKCVGVNSAGVQEIHFRVDIVVSGEWTHWTGWSQCSTSCGSGEQIRTRKCSIDNANFNPKLKIDKSKCVGNEIIKRKCFTECQKTWGDWTSCSATCGTGTRRRYRLCGDSELDCDRRKSLEEKCHETECPIHGQWSDWSEWSECSDPCGGGVMQRMRKCNSPPPEHGGDECRGWGTEIKLCNKHRCRDEGIWLPWSEWSPCSETCGKGLKTRDRQCKASGSGTCEGQSLQIKKCFVRTCHKTSFPSSARLHVKGNLNGNVLDNRFDVDIENIGNKRQISANLNRNNEWHPYAPLILSPVSWNAANEVENADNGYSLTNGVFFSQSDIQFASGEELKLKHKGDGINENGSLTVEIEVLGEVPLGNARSYVFVKPPPELDFMQTSSNTLYSTSESNVTLEGVDVPYVWNSSIRYNASKGTMPYLVEKMSVNEVDREYNEVTQNVKFKTVSTIEKKFKDNHCPHGFAHDPEYMHCQDINECETSDSICQHDEDCVNTFGSYKCVCSNGFHSTERGCEDINECSRAPSPCSHLCHNVLGSYKCSCPPGSYLGLDKKTCMDMSRVPDNDDIYSEEVESTEALPDFRGRRLEEYRGGTQTMSCLPGYFFFRNECKDYNECEENPNICEEDETCVNFPGTYKCLSIPCPPGYERNKSNKRCVRRCTPRGSCKRGASVSESVVFRSISLKPSTSSVVYFDNAEEPQCNVVKTKYRIVESGDIFEVKVANGRASLHPLRKLKKDTLYRAKVEGFSYGAKDSLLYFTEFVLFIVPT